MEEVRDPVVSPRNFERVGFVMFHYPHTMCLR